MAVKESEHRAPPDARLRGVFVRYLKSFDALMSVSEMPHTSGIPTRVQESTSGTRLLDDDGSGFATITTVLP